MFNNVERKKKVKSYSGMRHILKLPVRGQRTHTNSKTSRNNIKKEL
ncbi:30S ribosomal protein S13 [Candidatus Paracaedibacter symbiosus]|nr:30S ribosomal protein S13 [Candidatus Paracaedibacter symbiosus]